MPPGQWLCGDVAENQQRRKSPLDQVAGEGKFDNRQIVF
jgi:hypothetical protein